MYVSGNEMSHNPSTPPRSSMDATYRTVTNESATLQFHYLGTGPLLILVPGGGAQSLQYDYIISNLASHFTTVAYDRRGMGMSALLDGAAQTKSVIPAPIPEQGPLNPAQHARDIVAIVKAMGRTKTSLFGNGGGAIIALECASLFPDIVEGVIVHDAPISGLLPDRMNWLDSVFELHGMYEAHGHAAASLALEEKMIENYDTAPPFADPRIEDVEQFWKHEFLSLILYCPQLHILEDHVKNGKLSITVGVGKDSGDVFFRRIGPLLAERLGCEIIEFPGHHSGFETNSAAFADVMVKTFESLGWETRRFELKN